MRTHARQTIFVLQRSRRVRVAAIAFSLVAAVMIGGCASSRVASDVVYFPPSPSNARVVHLKSFNGIRDLLPTRPSWRDVLRGTTTGAFVSAPAGVAVGGDHIYICDMGRGVVHDWDLSTGRAVRIGHKGDVVLSKPVAVATDGDGLIYVADTGRGEVVAFLSDGNVSRRFKPPDREDYQPASVAVHSGKLYVADLAAHRIDVFSTTSGEHIEYFGEVGSKPGTFYYPTGIAADRTGRVYVSDMMNARVQIFGPQHEFLLSMGRPGNRYGDMGKPKHIDVGPDGTIFVADSEFAHIHLFNNKGQLLMLVGGKGDSPGSTPMPFGVAIAETLPDQLASLVPEDFDAKYYLFATNSTGNKRISLFAIGEAR